MNIWTDEWDATDDWSGGGAKSKHLVDRGPLLGASLYELGPGNSAVYHFHHGSEELLIVLRGRPTLRGPGGDRQLGEGEVVHFPVGPDGAHGLHNESDELVRYVVARHPRLARSRRVPRPQADHCSGAHRFANGRAALDDSRPRARSGHTRNLTRLLPSLTV